MTIRASKVAINVREALNSLRKKTGLFGEQVMRTENATEYHSLVKPSSFRNTLINGDFRIWQRGTSFGASPGYTADRWSAQSNASGSTITREEFTSGQTLVPGNPQYYYRLTFGGTASPADRVVIRQMVENYQQFIGKTVTLSGWYRLTASIAGQNWLFQLKRSSSFYDNVTELSDPLGPLQPTSTWTYFERKVTVPAAILSGQTMTSTASFAVTLYHQTVASTGVFELANLQLEVGPSATPFESRPLPVELAMCQRYYYRIQNSSAGNAIGFGNPIFSYSATRSFGAFKMAVPMRASPSVGLNEVSAFTTTFGATAITGINVYQPPAVGASEYYLEYNAASGMTGIMLPYLNSSANAYIDFTSEL